MGTHECTALSTQPNNIHKLGNDLLLKFIPFLNVITFYFLSRNNNILQNIMFTMEEEGNEKVAFLSVLLKFNYGEVSILVYKKPMQTKQ